MRNLVNEFRLYVAEKILWWLLFIAPKSENGHLLIATIKAYAIEKLRREAEKIPKLRTILGEPVTEKTYQEILKILKEHTISGSGHGG